MRVSRLDRIPIPHIDSTKEGYLRGEAVVTRVGVFKYTDAAGNTHGELRHPDDVFAADSLNSLKAIPITVDHPNSFVTAANAGDLAVGLTGESPRADGTNILVGITVTHQRAIDAVQAGKKELSLGYTLELEEEAGVYDGEQYQFRQRSIDYNHLAIVDVARAGRIARLNTDGDAVEEEETDRMIKVNLDGIQYDAAPEVARALEKSIEAQKTAETALAAANKRADTAEAQADENKAKLATAEAAAATAKADADKGLGERVNARVALLATAAKFDSADFSAKTDREVMVAVVKTVHKDFADAGKSDDYVQARFDAVVGDGAPNPQIQQAAVPPVGTQQAKTDAAAAEASWQKSVNDLNAWRTKAN